MLGLILSAELRGQSVGAKLLGVSTQSYLELDVGATLLGPELGEGRNFLVMAESPCKKDVRLGANSEVEV